MSICLICVYIYVFSLYRTIMYFLVTGIHCVLKQYIYIYVCIYIYICKRYLWNLQKSTDRIFHNLEGKKYSHGKFPDNGSTHSIPSPLAKAFEHVILQRQMLGEENDIIFAQNTLENLIQLWNENIQKLRDEFEASMEGKVLQALDDCSHEGKDEEVLQHAMNALKDWLNELKTVNILRTPGALKCLGCKCFELLFFIV